MGASSCSSSDDALPETGRDGEITAQINGNLFLASEDFVGASLQSSTFNLTATNSNGDKVSISINDFDGEATVDLSGFTSDATGIYIPSGANRFFNTENEGGTGSITITEYNSSQNLVSGTFDFIAVRRNTSSSGEVSLEDISISNGIFFNINVSNF